MSPSPQCYIPSHKVIGLLVLDNIFEGILPYMGIGAILAMCPRPRKPTFVPPSHWGSIWNLALIHPAVLEKKIFENGGWRMDDRPWLYYKPTNEHKVSGELTRGPVKSADIVEKKFKKIITGDLYQGQWMTFGTHKTSCTHFSRMHLPTFI